MTERLDRRQLLILLVSWSAAILVPGIILIGQSLTLAYIVWGLAFIGQLVLFVKITKLTRSTELWPWLFASVFPWVVNFETPGHAIWLMPIFIVVLAAVAAYLFHNAVVDDRLEHEGIDATGTVTEVTEPRFAKFVVTEGDVRRTVKLAVKRADRDEPYEASISGRFLAEEVPAVGDVLEVRIDPENPQRVVETEAVVHDVVETSLEADADSSEESNSD